MSLNTPKRTTKLIFFLVISELPNIAALPFKEINEVFNHHIIVFIYRKINMKNLQCGLGILVSIIIKPYVAKFGVLVNGAGLRERCYVNMSLAKGKPSTIKVPPKFQSIGMVIAKKTYPSMHDRPPIRADQPAKIFSAECSIQKTV